MNRIEAIRELVGVLGDALQESPREVSALLLPLLPRLQVARPWVKNDDRRTRFDLLSGEPLVDVNEITFGPLEITPAGVSKRYVVSAGNGITTVSVRHGYELAEETLAHLGYAIMEPIGRWLGSWSTYPRQHKPGPHTWELHPEGEYSRLARVRELRLPSEVIQYRWWAWADEEAAEAEWVLGAPSWLRPSARLHPEGGELALTLLEAQEAAEAALAQQGWTRRRVTADQQNAVEGTEAS